ncbi:C40 family peptidase [Nocardia brasiliensis]|uniref:C40 family peptidase n=1 Tax=Nocardia brasiliensis TaxID=37326 RepID=UPI002458AB6C|nr:NlpC/P60 family protein [Nocardia brasiliensis]
MVVEGSGGIEQEIRIGGVSAEVAIDQDGLHAELSVRPVPPFDLPPPPPETKDPPPAAERSVPPPAILPPAPPLDPYMLSTALLAGLSAMTALPMIVVALRGLSGGAGSGTIGGPSISPGGVALGNTALRGTEAAMSAEQSRALGVLRLLADVYGEQGNTDPRIASLREQLGGPAESGATAAAVRARRLYQRTRAAAFNNLDKSLDYCIRQLAQNNAVDREAIRALLAEVNAALAKLGTRAYTVEGRQRVHDVLTAALNNAQRIVAAGNVSAGEIAAAIQQLTAQYLHNIAGKNYSPSLRVSSGGASAAARTAVETARAQIGDPYIWGDEGPNSFDCSGLMQYSAKSAGVDIPRVAADQYNNLPKVAASDIRPGDLIFPESRFEGGRAKHVMMYVGNGICIESPQAGGHVQETALPSSFRAARWAP